MKPEIPKLLLILKEACDNFGYSWKLVDSYANNLVEVSNGFKSFFSSNSKIGAYPLNLKFSAQLVNDKAWAYKILKQKKYKVPKGDYFFLKEEYRELRGNGKELSDAIIFAKNKYPVFVKPNSSSLGILAEIIENEKQLKNHLQNISEISYIAIIQEIIKLPEYRIFAIDGEIEFIYQRFPAKIIGDGKSSINNQISNINQNIKSEKNKFSKNSIFIVKQLKKYNLDFNSVLNKNQELVISPKTNISSGGEIKNYTEIVSKETKKWIKKLMKDLSLRVCGIDVFIKNSKNNPNEFIIIEINHNPNLTGIYELGYKEKALQIWGKILNKYFNK